MSSVNHGKRKATINKILVYAVLIVFSINYMAPFLWMILTALKTPAEVNVYPPTFLPESAQWQNFVEVAQSQPIGTYLKNSLTISILTTFGQVLSSSMVAYGFARFDFKGKNVLFMLLLGTMMLPWDVTMIPMYMLFNKLGWINSLKSLIVPSFFGSAYNIFLLRQFLTNMHPDIENAAKVDGANTWTIFSRIVLPIMKSPLILIAILNFVTTWNDYLGPLIFLQDRSKYTLALGLASFQGIHNTNIMGIMVMTVMMVIPPVLIYFFAQKYIIEGFSGSIK